MRELQDTESDWLSRAAGSRKSNTTTDVFLSGNSKMTLQPRLSASLRHPCPSLPINGCSHERTAAAVTGIPSRATPRGGDGGPPRPPLLLVTRAAVPITLGHSLPPTAPAQPLPTSPVPSIITGSKTRLMPF